MTAPLPVAHYAEDLASKVENFFDRLLPGKAIERRNFSLKSAGWLAWPLVPACDPVPPLDPADDGSPYWIRSERQTLSRLPGTNTILFTIKVQQAPLAVLLARRDRAADLLAYYASLDEHARRYKIDGNDLNEGVIPWLAGLASPDPG